MVRPPLLGTEVVIDSLRAISRRFYPQAFTRTDDSLTIIGLLIDSTGAVVRRTSQVRRHATQNESLDNVATFTNLFPDVQRATLSEIGIANLGVPMSREPTIVAWAFVGPKPKWSIGSVKAPR